MIDFCSHFNLGADHPGHERFRVLMSCVRVPETRAMRHRILFHEELVRRLCTFSPTVLLRICSQFSFLGKTPLTIPTSTRMSLPRLSAADPIPEVLPSTPAPPAPPADSVASTVQTFSANYSRRPIQWSVLNVLTLLDGSPPAMFLHCPDVSDRFHSDHLHFVTGWLRVDGASPDRNRRLTGYSRPCISLHLCVR